MKTVIIGAGAMGRRHIEAAKHLEILGVCDLNEDALKDVNETLGITQEKLFTDASAMLNKVKPELLIISTTAPSHYSIFSMGIKAGCTHILCEKPMATSLIECDKMINEARENGVLLSINHQQRFISFYKRAKELLNSSEFGGIKSITINAGNFGLSMNATHYFEMFRFITDDEPSKVNAWFSEDILANPRGKQFSDRAGQVRVESKSGKRLYIECGADQGHGLSVTFNARNGQIVSDELTGKMSIAYRKEEFRDMPTSRYAMPAEYSVEEHPVDIIEITRNIIDALIAGENYTTGEQGRKAIEVLVAAHTSAENNNIAIMLDDNNLDRKQTFPWA